MARFIEMAWFAGGGFMLVISEACLLVVFKWLYKSLQSLFVSFRTGCANSWLNDLGIWFLRLRVGRANVIPKWPKSVWI